MPGAYIIKPIEANLLHNTDLITKMNPYCSFVVGGDVVNGPICKKGGKHPHWDGFVRLPVNNNQKMITLDVMDRDKITHDDVIGSCMLDLSEAQTSGQLSKWYPLTYKNKEAGEILLEAVFQPDAELGGQTQQFAGQTQQFEAQNQQFSRQTQQKQQASYQEEAVVSEPPYYQLQEEREVNTQIPLAKEYQQTTTTAAQSSFNQGNIAAGYNANLNHQEVQFTEQQQIVEPHTFIKEVESTEMRPVVKEIEVLEPQTVIKDVQVTQVVPVVKEIEVNEPQVVKKEVEVIEPRLVTKQIQVVENVPVIKQVEVVENRPVIQEVQVIEPRTFTKEVEVIEQVPVLKQVTTTEPVTVKKAVEYVEPVVTTQTITKELQQPVVVDEQITTTVGPATATGIQNLAREEAFVNTASEQALANTTSDVKVTQQKTVTQETKVVTAPQVEQYQTSATYQSNQQAAPQETIFEYTH